MGFMEYLLMTAFTASTNKKECQKREDGSFNQKIREKETEMTRLRPDCCDLR
jgi:hypothetical protein